VRSVYEEHSAPAPLEASIPAGEVKYGTSRAKVVSMELTGHVPISSLPSLQNASGSIALETPQNRGKKSKRAQSLHSGEERTVIYDREART
jgi:hypothetical protein